MAMNFPTEYQSNLKLNILLDSAKTVEYLHMAKCSAKFPSITYAVWYLNVEKKAHLYAKELPRQISDHFHHNLSWYWQYNVNVLNDNCAFFILGKAVLLYENEGHNTINMYHTQVPTELRGRGIAGQLAKVK